MSNTSVRLPSVKPIQSIQERPPALSEGDLLLVAERLSLIRGHIGKMPATIISGAMVREGYLLVALKITEHEITIEYSDPKDLLGKWLIDGKDVTPLTENVV